jgi:hypothetical protein
LSPSPASIQAALTCSPQTAFFVASPTIINPSQGLASAARTDGIAGIVTSVAQYQISDDRSIKMDSLQATFLFFEISSLVDESLLCVHISLCRMIAMA